jgi:hypothetical protein
VSVWTVVYIATTQQVAEKVKNLLAAEGILVTLKTVEIDEHGKGSIEVRVPEGEVDEAQEILAENLGRLR